MAGAVLSLVACVGERVHNAGLRALDAGQYEEGVQKLEQAVREAPGNMTYRLDLAAQRERAVQALVARADRARTAGSLDEADASYRRVLVIEPTNDRALSS
jgi:general secretion pathway protein D